MPALFLKDWKNPLRSSWRGETVESYVKRGEVLTRKIFPRKWKEKPGYLFLYIRVMITRVHRTIEPDEPNIAQEIIRKCRSILSQDPRFSPVTPENFRTWYTALDVLTEPEPVKSEKDLDPKKYGAIVEAGWRRGCYCWLEGVDTVKHQLEICRMKAGIGMEEPVKLYRFEVKRYK